MVYDMTTGHGSNACFDSTWSDYCTYFGFDDKVYCKTGGDIRIDSPSALAISESLVLCDAGVPGCSTNKFVCSGTTLPCNEYDPSNAWLECDCRPQVGYTSCNVMEYIQRPSEAKINNTVIRNALDPVANVL